MAIELDANSFPGYRALGVSLAGLGRYEEAIEALKTCVLISARHPWPLVELCWVYSLTDRVSDAQKITDELILRSKTEFISMLMLSGAAYFSKNYDKAFEFLELAFDQRDGALPCMKTWPLCSYISEDPRFQPFLKRMNFPDRINKITPKFFFILFVLYPILYLRIVQFLITMQGKKHTEINRANRRHFISNTIKVAVLGSILPIGACNDKSPKEKPLPGH